MKKILALTLTGILVLSGATVAASATVNAAAEMPALHEAAAENNLYLVPGTYQSGGQKVENAISAGATKLSADECEEIHTDNAYLCTLSEGDALPTPTSDRVDKAGNPYSFNGWWSIVDATVTYFETVPALSETTYLYADWRADLSQRKDPVEADDSTIVMPKQYLSVVRADAEEPIIIPLYVSGTDVYNAFDFGYGKPVQLYNGWFELQPGDVITVYTTGLGDSTEEPQISPIAGKKQPQIDLESSSMENNDTNDYLTVAGTNKAFSYKAATARHFRIYIKFFDEGCTMKVYMQPKD